MFYNSCKSSRVECSVLGQGQYAFADAYDFAYFLRHDLAKIFGICFPLLLLTDSMSLFHLLILKSTASIDKGLMIDVVALQETYGRNNITNVAWRQSQHNFADVFTKPGFSAPIESFKDFGSLDLHVSQRVVPFLSITIRSTATAVPETPLFE